MIDDGDTYYDDEKRGQKLVIEMGKRIGKNGATSSGRGQWEREATATFPSRFDLQCQFHCCCCCCCVQPHIFQKMSHISWIIIRWLQSGEEQGPQAGRDDDEHDDDSDDEDDDDEN